MKVQFDSKLWSDGFWAGSVTVVQGNRQDQIPFTAVEGAKDLSDQDLALRIMDVFGIPVVQEDEKEE